MERSDGSDIEGKVARVSEERVGKRASFKRKRRNRGITGSLACLAIWNSHAERQRNEGPPHRGKSFVLGSFFLRHRFLSDDDFWELHDVGDGLGSILTEGRLERQFSVSDLG